MKERLTVSVVVSAFETLQLSSKTDEMLDKHGRSIYAHDKRTKRGKMQERLSNAIIELSEVAFDIGLDSVTELFESSPCANNTMCHKWKGQYDETLRAKPHG